MKFVSPVAGDRFDVGEKVKFRIADVPAEVSTLTLKAENKYVLGTAAKSPDGTWTLEKRFSSLGHRFISAVADNVAATLDIYVEMPKIGNYVPPSESLELLGDVVRKLEENGVHRWDTKYIGCRATFTLNSGAFYIDSDFDLDTDGARGIGGDGTHQADTSLHNKSGEPLDANSIPFYVLPMKSPFLSNGVSMGDVAVVVCEDKMSIGIFGDFGPKNKVGEGSIQMHRELGFERVYKNSAGKLRIRDVGIDRVVTVVFPGSGAELVKNGKFVGTELETVTRAREIGKKLWVELGGKLLE